MSSSVVSVRDNTSRQLDRKPAPDVIVTAADVGDPEKLARLLASALADIAALKGLFVPRAITFRDIVSTGTAGAPYKVRLPHGFRSGVEWSLVGQRDATSTVPMASEVTAESTPTTLVLNISYAGTFAVRVVEAG